MKLFFQLCFQLGAAVTLLSMSSVSQGQAQAQGFYIYPPNPTSADQLRLHANQDTCFGGREPRGANPFSVRMANNHITITLKVAPSYGSSAGTLFDVPSKYIDLARLPAGEYTWSVVDESGGRCEATAPKDQRLVVTDARSLQPAPYALQNLSGHWWNFTDPGTGLFFWQDEKDNTMGAWVTYDKSGAAKWYVFQPKWETYERTAYADLLEASRPPSSSSPAYGKTELKVVGRARFWLEGSSWPPSGTGLGSLPNALGSGQRARFSYEFNGQSAAGIEMKRFPETTLR